MVVVRGQAGKALAEFETVGYRELIGHRFSYAQLGLSSGGKGQAGKALAEFKTVGYRESS
jgi:hypothetical protein